MMVDKVSAVLLILIFLMSVTGATAFAFSFPTLIEEGEKADMEDEGDGLFTHSDREPYIC